jgi:hypothetical protein
VEQPEQENEPVTLINVAVDWSAAAVSPTTHVNQFIAQIGPPISGVGPDGVYLLMGSIPPPLVIGNDPETRQRSLDALKDGLKVTVHGRFQMSRERLEELIQVLHATADNYDAAVDYARRGAALEDESAEAQEEE